MLFTAEALFGFEAKAEQELSLSAGDVVQVLDDVSQWWVVSARLEQPWVELERRGSSLRQARRSDGREGLVPSNFVQRL